MFYIGVECNWECEYELRAVYSKEIKMKMNDELALDFNRYDDGSEYSKIIKIKTDKDIEDYDYLNIEVEFDNWYDFLEGFNVYLSESPETPSSSSYARVGEDVSIGIKLIQLHKADLFKANAEYELLIEAPSQAQLYITTYTYERVRTFELYDYVDDLIDDSGIKNYILQLDEIESDVTIQL